MFNQLKEFIFNKIHDFIENHCIVDYDEYFEDEGLKSTPSDTNAPTSERTVSDKA